MPLEDFDFMGECNLPAEALILAAVCEIDAEITDDSQKNKAGNTHKYFFHTIPEDINLIEVGMFKNFFWIIYLRINLTLFFWKPEIETFVNFQFYGIEEQLVAREIVLNR